MVSPNDKNEYLFMKLPFGGWAVFRGRIDDNILASFKSTATLIIICKDDAEAAKKIADLNFTDAQRN
jgi:hypothetical protein